MGAGRAEQSFLVGRAVRRFGVSGVCWAPVFKSLTLSCPVVCFCLGVLALSGMDGRIKRLKSIWWMPWHREAMKDVARCDKPWGVASAL